MKHLLSIFLTVALLCGTAVAQNGGVANTPTPTLKKTTHTLAPKSVVTAGDTLSYCGNTGYQYCVGYSNSSDNHAYWGIMIPASDLTGHNYLKSVMLYVYYEGSYTMHIYSGGTSVPNSLIHTQSETFTSIQRGWNEILLDSTCYIAGNNLWITFETYGIAYPAAASYFCGDANGDWITNNLSVSSWYHAIDGASCTWMIKAVTSATIPAPTPLINIYGPTAVAKGDTATFIFHSPNANSMTWNIMADHLAISGDTARAVWNTAGTKQVIVNATNNNGSSADTLEVDVLNCTVSTFPFSWDFEDVDQFVCWKNIDQDGNSNGWYVYYNENHLYSADSSAGFIYSNSYNSTPDNWIISPAIQLPANMGARLSWAAGPYSSSLYSEHYAVYVSTTGTDVDDFVQLQQYDLTSSNWTHPTLNLSAYAGQTIHVAFRHYNCNADLLMLDNITIETGNSISITCTGIGSGEVYRTDDYPEDLCGTTDLMPTGMLASYDFIPTDGHLAHLYVNNVDHINDVVTLSSGSSVTLRYSFTVTGNTTLNPVFNYDFYPVSFDCAGDGLGIVSHSAYFYDENSSLCGQIDSVRQGFYASYSFIPSTGNEMTHLYVNNVDRINDAYHSSYGTYSSASYYMYEFQVNAATTVRPVFSRIPYTVTATSANTAMGMVSGGGNYFYDSTVTVTATPMPHYTFLYWKAVITGETDTVQLEENPFTFEMTNRNVELIAVFGVESYTITVAPNNVLYGSVEGGGTFEYLQPVTVSATAYSGYHFAMWSNGSPHNPYTFPASENLDLVAVFLADGDTTQYFAIATAVNDGTMGTVEGGGAFALGTTTTLTAIPNEGYHFVQWQDGNTDNPRTVTVTANAEYTAYFAADQGITYTLTVLSANETMGTVTGGGSYAAGEEVTLTATPNEGFRFAHWQDGDTLNPRTVTVTEDATFIATFASLNGIVSTTDDGTRVYSYADRILVAGAAGRSVKVYDLSGRLMTRVDRVADAIEFNMNHTGVYIVTVGNDKAYRVIVR